MIAKRSAFDAVGLFDPTLRSSEDREMWIRITAKYKGLQNGDRLICARRHPNNMSKHADRMRLNTRRVLRQAFANAYVPRSAIFFWLRVFSFNHFETAWMYHDEGRRGLALREIIFSLLLWPWFPKPNLLNEPSFFRARSLVRILREFGFSSRNSLPASPVNQSS